MFKNINLNKLTISLLLFSNFIYAQSILVTGKVVDKQGQPLPGVSILLKDSILFLVWTTAMSSIYSPSFKVFNVLSLAMNFPVMIRLLVLFDLFS